MPSKSPKKRVVFETVAAIPPWPSAHLGRRRNRDYTHDEVIDALIQATKDLERPVEMLTTTAYYAWAAEQHRRAREQGADVPQAPLQPTIDRLFEKKFANARAAAVRRLRGEDDLDPG